MRLLKSTSIIVAMFLFASCAAKPVNQPALDQRSVPAEKQTQIPEIKPTPAVDVQPIISAIESLNADMPDTDLSASIDNLEKLNE